MPIIIQMKYTDGTSRTHRIPVEIWRKNTEKVTKLFISEKEVAEFELDPYLETADTDRGNNYIPRQNIPTRFQLYKSTGSGRFEGGSNPMREAAKK